MLQFLKNRKLILSVKYSLGIIIIIFISYNIYINAININYSKLKINYAYILFSMSFIIAGQIIQYSVWQLITYFVKIKLNFLKTIKIRIYSELGKYIPGRVVLYGMLFYFYKQNNVSQKKIAFCSIFESLATLISAILVFFISIPFSNLELTNIYKIASISFFVLGLIVIHPKILQFLLNIVLKIFKKEPVIFELSYFKVLLIVILYSIIWLIFGFSFYFMINSFYSVSLSYYWFLTGAFAFSSFLGFLAFFVPAGLGVREGSIIIILSKVMAEPFSGIASIASRLLIIAGDIIITMIIFLIDFFSDEPVYKTYFRK